MYPNLYYLFKDLFQLDIPFLKSIHTFGLFEAMGFYAAAWVLTKELKRKQFLNEFGSSGISDKILPSSTVPFVTMLAAVSGILGAKIFSLFDHHENLIQHPLKTILSESGFAFYGGLITAAITLWVYYSLRKISPIRIADAVALGLMPAYAIGRIGCHISGDGDWGINNLNPKPFKLLPDWLWAYSYPNNVSMKGNIMPNCNWDMYCHKLGIPVYPTPLYEAMIIFLLFLILWGIRKRIKIAGRISAIYLIMIASERFLIETIRVNNKFQVKGIMFSQAQLISVLLIFVGTVLYSIAHRLKTNRNNP